MANLREASKDTWIGNGTIEHINAGSLQRIADATEAMSKNYVGLQSTCDWYKKNYREEQERRQKLERRLNSLKGYITRLKKAAAVKETDEQD